MVYIFSTKWEQNNQTIQQAQKSRNLDEQGIRSYLCFAGAKSCINREVNLCMAAKDLIPIQ